MQESVTTDFSKALPHDEFAERAILGAMLIDNKYANEVFSEITSGDFYRDAHKNIAAVVDYLTNSGSTADIVTVAGHLKKKKELKFVGGYEYINSLIDGIPENVNIAEYIKIVKDRAALRRIILTSMGVIRKGVEEKAETESILNELQEDIIKISESRQKEGFHSCKELVPQTMGLIESIQKHGDSGGLKTEFLELDAMTGGFQKSDLIVIAARPSMGKTALALNIADNIALAGKRVGFFSIEMARYQIIMRLLALKTEIGLNALRSGKPHFSPKEWSKLELASGELGKAEFFIDDSASLSIVEMKTRARRLMNERGLDIVFADYLQLIKVSGDAVRRNDSRAQEVAVVTASLKEIAKELEIPVVALAQLNRAPEHRGIKKEGGPKYQLSDLKESGAIEQDADVVIFLHRDDQIDKETERKGVADLIVAKQRNGPTGRIELAFQDKYTKFKNLGKDYYM
jgi:replicative DNA helicase